MERFTERDIDLWRQWMGIEFTYGVNNHGGAAAHVGSANRLKQGILFAPYDSWGNQAVRYVREATQAHPVLEEKGSLPKSIGLKVARAFGKYAQNNIACLAYAKTIFDGLQPHELDYEALLSHLAEILPLIDAGDVAPRYIDLDETLVEVCIREYRELQDFQTQGSSDRFINKITALSLVNSAGFMASTQEYGWPTPGVSSTQNPTTWTSAS